MPEQPIEPSDIYRADGTRVPGRRAPSATPSVRSLLPALVRSATAGPLVAASALAVGAALAAVAGETARRVVEQAARDVIGMPARQSPDRGFVEVTITRIEVRWPL
jgi:hypothetical protein